MLRIISGFRACEPEAFCAAAAVLTAARAALARAHGSAKRREARELPVPCPPRCARLALREVHEQAVSRSTGAWSGKMDVTDSVADDGSVNSLRLAYPLGVHRGSGTDPVASMEIRPHPSLGLLVLHDPPLPPELGGGGAPKPDPGADATTPHGLNPNYPKIFPQ